MTCGKIEKKFEKEYGKKKGDRIYFSWKNEHKKYDYCPHCRKRTEHIKEMGHKMCKHCGHIEKI